MKMRLHIDPKAYISKPSGNELAGIKARLQKNAIPTAITVEELAKQIETGHAISPAVMGGMSASDWQEQQLFLVDIDNEADEILARKRKCEVDELLSEEKTPILHIEEALNISSQHNLTVAFYYPTFSSCKSKPKYRLGFIMDKPVTDANKRQIIINALISFFQQSDKACGNADRIFHGTNMPVIITNVEARISLDLIYNAFTQPVSETPVFEANSHEKACSDLELGELKQNFDLFGYMKQRNGKFRRTSRGAVFKDCEICGHHENLVYFAESNTFYCFSPNGGVGGSIIDYLIYAENISIQQAIDKLKYELCGLKKPYDDYLLKQFEQRKPELNCAFNDKDYSRLFSDVFQNKCRFNIDANEWYVYTGKVWIKDKGSMNVRQYAKDFVNTLFVYAIQISDEQRKKAFLEYITKLSQYRFRDTLIKDARDNHYIRNADLDRDGKVLNCQNGTLDLITFELRPHNSDDLLSKITNTEYQPNAPASRFNRYIHEVMQGDTQKAEYLQKIFGYALTADTSLETCFILYGATTRNGKSTLIETIAYMLGNGNGYALTMLPLSLAQKQGRDGRQANGDIARLDGCRFLSVSEFPQKMIFDEAALKQLLGRDKIVARRLYESEFEFTPNFKLFMNTNALPMVNDETLFASGRINVITFDRHFEPSEQDKHLKDKLIQPKELSGILNWCLDGLRMFRENGAVPPKSVLNATEQYKANSNKISLFLRECLEPGNNVKMKTVYELYKLWCENSGYQYEGKASFFDAIKKRNLFTAKARVDGRTESNVICGKQVKQAFLPVIIKDGEKE